MKLNSLQDVLTDYIRDLYSAEAQLVKALPKMAKAASSPELTEAFESHLEETETQLERLEQICKDMGIKPRGKTCHAMKGLIEEGQEVIDATGDPAARDAALIGAAQKVEHYEIASYGTARTFASLLAEEDIAKLLQQTLDEESAANEKLTALAEAWVYDEAASDDQGEGEDGMDESPRSSKAGRSSKASILDDVDEEDDVEEAGMRTGQDDESDAPAPSPRGQTATKSRKSVSNRAT